MERLRNWGKGRPSGSTTSVEEMEEQISAGKQKIASLESEIECLKEGIKILDTNLGALTTNFGDLSTNVRQFEARLSAGETSISSLNSKIERQESDLASFGTEIAEIETEAKVDLELVRGKLSGLNEQHLKFKKKVNKRFFWGTVIDCLWKGICCGCEIGKIATGS